MATYTVKPGQNIFDVALALYGSVEGVFDLLISNPTLSMASDIAYGQELEYHTEFVLNQSILDEFSSQNITPSSSERRVYFKRPEEDLVIIIGANPELEMSYFKVAGEGVMLVDWGDNTELEKVELSTEDAVVSHYFDNTVEERRIRIYGNTETLALTRLDTTGIGGALVLCRPLTVDQYTCIGRGYSLTGLALFQGTFSLDLGKCDISSLIPIADMDLQELDLRGVRFVLDNTLDDYLVYIRNHYGSRRPCTVRLTSEPTARGYEAIDTILGEEEWNQPETWKFYINDELYIPQENGEDA